jgi:hypothetical protein
MSYPSWQWFDGTKWISYPQANSLEIEKAFIGLQAGQLTNNEVPVDKERYVELCSAEKVANNIKSVPVADTDHGSGLQRRFDDKNKRFSPNLELPFVFFFIAVP